MGRIKLFIVVSILLLHCASSSVLALNYTFIDLGTLGGTKSVGYSINDNRQVTGYSWYSGQVNNRAFLYDGSVMQDLGILFGGIASQGHGVNSSGQVAGYSVISSEPITRAIFFNGTTTQDLGTLGGTNAQSNGINDNGQVTGYSRYTAGSTSNHAFLWDSINGMEDIGTLGGADSFGFAINNSGQVTGDSTTGVGEERHAFLYDGSTMQDLGTLGGTQSFGKGINNSGQVTGFSRHTSNDTNHHAFFYDGSIMHDLGTLGGQTSEGLGINDKGQVVGMSFSTSDSNPHAFLWDSTNGMMDLCVITDCTSAGWSYLTYARDINNNGDITGQGIIGGQLHAFIAVANNTLVTIDIKPGTDPNDVNLRSKGVVPVAILGSIDFDATQIVDFTTVKFGPAEASPEHDGHVEDVNGDGFPDMVFHFKTQETGIACGDTEATLTGETFGGLSITGTDSIKTVRCKIEYEIGDTGPAGGVVFYVTDGGSHGLEAAPADLPNAEWGCFGTTISGADGTMIGTGAQNTADILAGCGTAGIAARLADNFTLNGYNDWFLPSTDELNELFVNRLVVGGFASRFYWSSSEINDEDAWDQDFFDGGRVGGNKDQFVTGVRAVRAF